MEEGLVYHLESLGTLISFSMIPSILEHNIPEKLNEGPKSIDELSQGTSINPERLQRYLLNLETDGLFSFDQISSKWSHSDRSRLLLGDIFKTIWLWHMSPFILSQFLCLKDVLTSNKTANEARGLENIFVELSKDPKMLELFHNALGNLSQASMPDTIKSMNLDNVTKILDVGGGNGTLVIGLCNANPTLLGGIFDRSEVALLATESIKNQGLEERIQVIQGDFFENIQEGFDCIVMKYILHDWNDEECIRILTNCRRALQVGNKLFIVDYMVDRDSKFYKSQIALDLTMLVVNKGKERNATEMEFLFERSGFKLESVKPALNLSVVEALAI